MSIEVLTDQQMTWMLARAERALLPYSVAELEQQEADSALAWAQERALEQWRRVMFLHGHQEDQY